MSGECRNSWSGTESKPLTTGRALTFPDNLGSVAANLRGRKMKLPDQVDAMRIYQEEIPAGVAINPGPEWSVDAAHAKSRIRICFASPSHEQIREGIAALAEVCRAEFGVPARSANVQKRA